MPLYTVLHNHYHYHIGLESKLNRLLAQGEQIMADTQAALTSLAEANASLDGIKADIAALAAQVNSGATPDEVFAAITALHDRLAATDAER